MLIIQLVNFDYFVVKNDHSLVTFNYSISHLQLTIKNSQIWRTFSDYLSSEKRTRWIFSLKMTYFRLKDQTNIRTRKYYNSKYGRNVLTAKSNL